MKTTVFKPHKSSLGLDANILAGLIWVAPFVLALIPVIGWVTWVLPIVIFFIEKDSKLVKFHAATSIVLMIISVIIGIIFGIISLIVFFSMAFGSFENIIGSIIGGGYIGLIIFFIVTLLISLAALALLIFLAVMGFTWKQVELPLIGPFAMKLCGGQSGSSSKKGKQKK